MATIQEYIKYFKNITFQDNSFNDIDSMLFTQIVYADFEGIIPKERGKYILFSDAIRLYLKKYEGKKSKKMPRFFGEVYHLLEDLKDAKRYANIKMYHYKKMVDNKKQFCAYTLRFQGITYVVFEGTDTSIVGWKEDFMMTHLFPVPAQTDAMEYLNQTIGLFDSKVLVGGHSKGGNLAMTASMFSSSRVRNKIKTVYNFDGPGFRKKEYESIYYARMGKKLKMFVPEDSIVGLMLLHPCEYKVVKSNGIGVWQHDPLTWECFGNIFIEGELTSRSASLEKSSLEFIESMNDEEREQFINSFFAIFDKLGIKDTSQLMEPKLAQALQFIRELTTINSDMRKKLIALVKLVMKGA